MSLTTDKLWNRRATFALALCGALALASALPLSVASCRTRQTARADEPAAYERLRLLTRGGVAPAEPAVAQLAEQFKGTRTGSLAQLLRARMRFEARDYAGAAELLRSA
ncbi:MAG TPA: tetratricopeptide repeat protein, partial [Pyrinomonadaceae bacterium]